MTNSSEIVFWRVSNPILWGVAATLAIVGLMIASAFLETCADGNCQSKWLYLINASPNEVGDTLAGFAGTLAFIWIIVTVAMQSIELKEQRKVLSDQRMEFQKTNENMAAQRFEVSFFELLSTLNNIIESIDMVNKNGLVTAKGRDCIRIFYDRLKNKFDKKSGQNWELQAINAEFWEQYGHEFGHYFRFLFNYFRIVSESSQSKERHGKLLRAMLSDHELLLLFYNCLYPKGEKMLKYVVEFKVFDNLPVPRLLNPDHVNLVDHACFGDNPGLDQKNTT